MRTAYLRISVVVIGWLLCLPAAHAQSAEPAGKEPCSAYLFTYFTGNRQDQEQIRFALSDDGLHFHALNHNQPVLSSAAISSTGGVRDPHILRGEDGRTFYMVATDMVSAKGWSSNRAIVLLRSVDLVNWTSSVVNIQQRFPGHEQLLRVWAPQTIYDAKAGKYMVYFSMKHGNDPDKIYYAYANKDFTDLETPPRQLFFSPTNGACIDGDIIYKNGLYHLFFKTEGEGAGIKVAVSDKLTEGYVLRDKYVQQTSDPVEGAGVFPLNDGKGYILMYDVYTKGRYEFTRSDDLEHFSLLNQQVTMDFHPRHGTVLPITAREAQALREKWDNAPAKTGQVFDVKNPDYARSPFTGLTRQHWKDAALYLLRGAFGYIHSLDDPMQFPKQPGKSYPRNPGQIPTEKLEGLVRTLFVASPLLREDPALRINGIGVAEYYRHQLVQLLDTSSPTYIPHRSPNGGPSQILVELGALSVSLFAAPEVLWEPLSREQKDKLAATMLSYGDGPTVGSNWKFFNIFVLSFFKAQGYPVNEKLLLEYLDKSLAHYRGNGWYNDAPAYDYYSMWAFQMYGPVWAEFFGKKYYPEYAAKFDANFRDLKNNYPYLFSRNGEMILWGRSMSYRIASVIPFPLMGMVQDTGVNYGWMRRIASGVLLQFFRHPDFLKDGVPTLGFYGAFEPAVQPYSCRGSVYWMGKAFMALLIPPDNPFWTATENEGAWAQELEKDKVYNKYQDSSHILITDYPGIGASEIRAWCHVRAIGNWEAFRSSENYNRLSYNSAFPWQADSVTGVVAMNYIIRNAQKEWEPWRLYDFKKFEAGIYYRDVELETNPHIRFNLADIPLPNGILRVDRNISTDSVEMRLGHYALPALKGPIREEKRKWKGQEIQIIDNGEYQLAMVPLKGWTGMQTIATKNVHPQSTDSKVINVSATCGPAGSRPVIYATLMLWKRSGERFTEKELQPVRSLKVSADGSAVDILFRDGGSKRVQY